MSGEEANPCETPLPRPHKSATLLRFSANVGLGQRDSESPIYNTITGRYIQFERTEMSLEHSSLSAASPAKESALPAEDQPWFPSDDFAVSQAAVSASFVFPKRDVRIEPLHLSIRKRSPCRATKSWKY